MVLADGTLRDRERDAEAGPVLGAARRRRQFRRRHQLPVPRPPVATVYAGPIFWDQGQAARSCAGTATPCRNARPRALPFLGLKTVPSTAPFPQEIWGRRICALICCYAGAAEEAERAMRPIRTDLPKPIFEFLGEMPFPALQGLFDPLLPILMAKAYPASRFWGFDVHEGSIAAARQVARDPASTIVRLLRSPRLMRTLGMTRI